MPWYLALGRCAVEVGTWLCKEFNNGCPGTRSCALSRMPERAGFHLLARPIANPRSEHGGTTRRPPNDATIDVDSGRGQTWARVPGSQPEWLCWSRTEHRALRTGEPAFGHSVADLLCPSPVRPYGHSAGRRVPSALRQRRHSPRQRRLHLHFTSQLQQ